MILAALASAARGLQIFRVEERLMNELRARFVRQRPPTPFRKPLPMSAWGASALGAAALGAFAVGAVAIGRLAVGRLVIGRLRVGRLEVDELTVGRLNVREQSEA